MPIDRDIEQDWLYKGIQKEIEKTVIRCLEKGIAYEQIASITDFTIEEIKAIEKNKNSLMAIDYDIKEDWLYKLGFGKKYQKEIEELIIRCLEKSVTYERIAFFSNLTIEEIKAIEIKKKTSQKP